MIGKMQTKFLIQQCLVLIATTTATKYDRHRTLNLVDDLEFGRAAKSARDDIIDNEV